MPSFDNFKRFCVSSTDFVYHTLQNYKNRETFWDIKDDGTRVTEVDFFIEDKLREQISKSYPNHGISGEERDSINPNADYVWVLDPIDGTFGFSKGVPLFGTLIGLTYRGQPKYGFLRLPMINNTWLAGDCIQTCLDGKLLRNKPFLGWTNSLILTTDQETLRKSTISKYWQKAIKLGATARTWGDCYGYYLLCIGEADMVVDTGLKPYDIIPLIPILLGAGMEVNQLGGKNFSEIMTGRKEVLSSLV